MTDDTDSATGRLRRLRGVTWRWRATAPRRARRSPEVGVIAQEVERVFPQLVSVNRRGHKQVAYIGLIGPLIEAVKELDARLSEVEDRLSAVPGQPPERERGGR